MSNVRIIAVRSVALLAVFYMTVALSIALGGRYPVVLFMVMFTAMTLIVVGWAIKRDEKKRKRYE